MRPEAIANRVGRSRHRFHAVAVEPGVVFTYGRNTQTNALLGEAGVEVITIVGAERGGGTA